MSETCKTCRKEFDSGIWMSSQFKDEKVLLFCSDKCKMKYTEMKLQRIKGNYPNYYKIIKNPEKNPFAKYLKKAITQNMTDKINRIVILERNVKGDLSKCNACKINFSAIQPCIICQLKIEKEEKLGRKLTKIEFYELGDFLR